MLRRPFQAGGKETLILVLLESLPDVSEPWPRPVMTLVPLTRDLLAALRTEPEAALQPLCSNGPSLAGFVREIAEATAAMIDRTRADAPWLGYLAVKEDDRILAGTCAFKAPPDQGVVEIAYFTFPSFEGMGVGGAMVRGLLEIALRNGVKGIVAHSAPAENASTRILRQHGFRYDGIVWDEDDGEVWRWWRLAA
jgi:RimJ/RimL family protein N-acetyltransferase